MTTIIWFQRDLRIQDNPALKYASQLQLPILPVYIFDPEGDRNWSMGSSSRWWLHYSLQALQKKLKTLGLDIFFFQGTTLHVLQKIIDKIDVKHIVWNHCYEPSALIREKKLIKLAFAKNCIAKGFHANLLFIPGQITTKQGNSYQVFTPFWRSCLKQEISKPEGKISKKLQLASYSQPVSLHTLDLLPHIPWAKDFPFLWQLGEDNALKKWKHFLKNKVHQYGQRRNFPAEMGTSMLSPHLHFGEISVKRIFKDLLKNTHTEVFFKRNRMARICLSSFNRFSSYSFNTTKSRIHSFPLEKKCKMAQSLAKRHDRNSYCRCWYAAIMATRLDAQSSSYDRSFFFG